MPAGKQDLWVILERQGEAPRSFGPYHTVRVQPGGVWVDLHVGFSLLLQREIHGKGWLVTRPWRQGDEPPRLYDSVVLSTDREGVEDDVRASAAALRLCPSDAVSGGAGGDPSADEPHPGIPDRV